MTITGPRRKRIYAVRAMIRTMMRMIKVFKIHIPVSRW